MTNSSPQCSVCDKSGTFRCSSCKTQVYCGEACQRSDWKPHKQSCSGRPSKPWYDDFRRCDDGSFHEGKLELITWDCPEEETGWGHILKEESDDLKRKFEGEFGGSEAKLYAHWPMAFRWTCCGTDAEMKFGCDHHGTGSRPCTCDFCKMGKPLPNRIYNERTAARMGLELPRGPDPRSYNSASAISAMAGRRMMGLDM